MEMGSLRLPAGSPHNISHSGHELPSLLFSSGSAQCLWHSAVSSAPKKLPPLGFLSNLLAPVFLNLLLTGLVTSFSMLLNSLITVSA